MKSGLFIPLLFATIFCFAQQKPAFKQIEYASYEEKEEGQLDTDMHFKINEKGIVIADIKTYKGPEHSTFMLSSEEIQLLNELFNDQTSLKSHKIKDRLEPRMHYAGSYYYLSVTNTNGKNEKLVYIPSFMTQRFYDIMDKIIQSVYKNKNKAFLKKSGLNTQKVIKEITPLHKTAGLPIIELPPPMAH